MAKKKPVVQGQVRFMLPAQIRELKNPRFITLAYIRENYDVSSYRGLIPVMEEMDASVEFDKCTSVDEAIEFFQEMKEDGFDKMVAGTTWSNSFINLTRNKGDVRETLKETENRLQVEVKVNFKRRLTEVLEYDTYLSLKEKFENV